MKLRGLLESRIGIERLEASDAASVFDAVADALVTAGAIDSKSRNSLKLSFLERERQGTTAFGFGVAIPHVFHPGFNRVHVVVARHPQGISFGAVDGQLTKLFICVVGPEADRECYLRILAAIAKTLRDRDWRRFLHQAPSTSGVFELLLEAIQE